MKWCSNRMPSYRNNCTYFSTLVSATPTDTRFTSGVQDRKIGNATAKLIDYPNWAKIQNVQEMIGSLLRVQFRRQLKRRLTTLISLNDYHLPFAERPVPQLDHQI